MTLSKRGYSSCGHPTLREEVMMSPRGTVMSILGPVTRVFCRHCGAEKRGRGFHGGTLDFDEAGVLASWGCVQRWFDADGGTR